MSGSGIVVDPITSVFNASPAWWKNQEACKTVHSFRRMPPKNWDIMQRCFSLYNVQSQSQHSVNQRREELVNEDATNIEDGLDPGENGDEMPDNQVPYTQEDEEIYHVTIDDTTRPSNEFTHETRHHRSPTVNPVQIPAARVQTRGRGRRSTTTERYSRSSRVSSSSGSRGSRKKHSFETTLTDTMTGFREFQRQSLQQLRPDMFDQDDYNNFDVAMKIFDSMELPNDTTFYWACIQALREDAFWRKYFIDRAGNPFEEKIQFLQALTGYTKDDERVGKRLSSGKHFGSPSSGGFHSGSPSSGGNNSWVQTSGGQWEQTSGGQWGTPPSGQQWGSSPNAQQWGGGQQWGTSLNAQQWGGGQQWGTPPSGQQWGSSPNVQQWGGGQQWGTPPNVQQWRSSLNTQQWRTPPSGQQWSSPPIAPQWDSSLSGQQWSSSPTASQCIPPTNVQRGFPLETQTETTTSGMYWSRHDRTSFNIMAICDLNMLFTYVWNGAPESCHDTAVLAMAQESDSEFPLPPTDKYYLVDSGYPNKQGFLAPYRSSRNMVFR